MTAQQWREKADAAAETFLIDLPLPSGMVIRARRPGPLRFERWQRLRVMIGQVRQGGPDALNGEEATEMAGLMREVVSWCCVGPRIAVDEGPDTVHPRDVPDRDLFAIVTWAMRTAEQLDAGADGGGEDTRAPRVGTGDTADDLSEGIARQSDGR